MHGYSRLQTQTSEYLLKWGVRIDMRGYALPRLVVIQRQLIELAVLFEVLPLGAQLFIPDF